MTPATPRPDDRPRITCTACAGAGRTKSACATCDGIGIVYPSSGYAIGWHGCPDCSNQRCLRCGGTGREIVNA